ncbi:DUF2927 domain-containing protein [Acidimangrovimonas sediminis]|uniref:DUF2927 domain-containing protein n=1 Tax=Acidimangrovimonas sediminis TaxID=2056283 RepID=UPI000C800E92|nr:DUF2927 domain-containing protein [Acidimangrovimonas sediminis]
MSALPRSAAAFLLLAVTSLAACTTQPEPVPTPQRAVVLAPVALPPMKTFGPYRATPPHLSNVDIARDFLDLSFRLESGRDLPWMSRFMGPVTVTMTGTIPPTAPAELDHVLARFRSEAKIDVHRIPGPANITIQFLPRAEMQALVPQAACFVAPRVNSWADYRQARGTSRLDWTTLKVRDKLAVFIPSDTAPQEIRDCLNEEVAQALGPLDDLYRLTESVFDDDNFQSVLTGFDMLMLRVYYAPELPAGTTRAEAAARLPAILARLNPAGEHITPRPAPGPTPRPWIDAIETALGPGTSDTRRGDAAIRAVEIAQKEGWTDARMAFSYFVLGRLARIENPETALHALQAADRIYRTLPDTEIQRAHIDMQLAAYALVADDPDHALTLIRRARPAAERAQNAALLATLYMIRADALAMKGDRKAARAARLDSIGWSRYGFGTEQTIQSRLAQIAALAGEPATGG